MPSWISRLWKQQAVLLLSALAAAVSTLFVPISGAYGSYMDFHSLSLLFCLMAVVAGFQACGVLDFMVRRLLSAGTSLRLLSLLLVLFSFFLSMLVTNDVALLTLVPLTILLLRQAANPSTLIRVLVLQTMAANLGSMATPIGNPQNLYLYQYFSMTPGAFFGTILPYALLSGGVLAVAALFVPQHVLSIRFDDTPFRPDWKRILPLCTLFVMALLTVLGALDSKLTFCTVLIYLLLFARPLFRQVDYSLLLTFVCFFVFSGNMKNIPAVHLLLVSMMNQSALLTSAFLSQIISNVPAAVLLSGFTRDASGLLLGVNLGGLGTPIASLASIITLRLYLKTDQALPGRYLLVFSLWNFAGVALLLLLALQSGK